MCKFDTFTFTSINLNKVFLNPTDTDMDVDMSDIYGEETLIYDWRNGGAPMAVQRQIPVKRSITPPSFYVSEHASKEYAWDAHAKNDRSHSDLLQYTQNRLTAGVKNLVEPKRNNNQFDDWYDQIEEIDYSETIHNTSSSSFGLAGFQFQQTSDSQRVATDNEIVNDKAEPLNTPFNKVAAPLLKTTYMNPKKHVVASTALTNDSRAAVIRPSRKRCRQLMENDADENDLENFLGKTKSRVAVAARTYAKPTKKVTSTDTQACEPSREVAYPNEIVGPNETASISQPFQSCETHSEYSDTSITDSDHRPPAFNDNSSLLKIRTDIFEETDDE